MVAKTLLEQLELGDELIVHDLFLDGVPKQFYVVAPSLCVVQDEQIVASLFGTHALQIYEEFIKEHYYDN